MKMAIIPILWMSHIGLDNIPRFLQIISYRIKSGLAPNHMFILLQDIIVNNNNSHNSIESWTLEKGMNYKVCIYALKPECYLSEY